VTGATMIERAQIPLIARDIPAHFRRDALLQELIVEMQNTLIQYLGCVTEEWFLRFSANQQMYHMSSKPFRVENAWFGPRKADTTLDASGGVPAFSGTGIGATIADVVLDSLDKIYIGDIVYFVSGEVAIKVTSIDTGASSIDGTSITDFSACTLTDEEVVEVISSSPSNLGQVDLYENVFNNKNVTYNYYQGTPFWAWDGQDRIVIEPYSTEAFTLMIKVWPQITTYSSTLRVDARFHEAMLKWLVASVLSEIGHQDAPYFEAQFHQKMGPLASLFVQATPPEVLQLQPMDWGDSPHA